MINLTQKILKNFGREFVAVRAVEENFIESSEEKRDYICLNNVDAFANQYKKDPPSTC